VSAWTGEKRYTVRESSCPWLQTGAPLEKIGGLRSAAKPFKGLSTISTPDLRIRAGKRTVFSSREMGKSVIVKGRNSQLCQYGGIFVFIFAKKAVVYK